MAWQTPKTNWGASDGVRDSDFNRIEGNILDLDSRAGLGAAKTVYVATTGNDIAGDGSVSAPYLTIGKALSSIPRNLNGKAVVIKVATGTYREDVAIEGFSGTIVFEGDYSQVAINTMTVHACVCMVRSMPLLFTNSGLYIENGATFVTDSVMTFDSTGQYGIYAAYGSRCIARDIVDIRSTSIGVLATTCSSIYAEEINGSDNTTGVISERGSIVAYNYRGITAGTATIARTGGRIYSGAQSSVPNY